ncbi:MAG TPA: hypothetical protein VIP77_24270 [Jiangellaceae bacterium]
MSKTDELLRAALNIEETSTQIPPAADVVDQAIGRVLRDWQKLVDPIVGPEAARDAYEELQAILQPVGARVESSLQTTGAKLEALAQTRRDARAEATK